MIRSRPRVVAAVLAACLLAGACGDDDDDDAADDAATTAAAADEATTTAAADEATTTAGDTTTSGEGTASESESGSGSEAEGASGEPGAFAAAAYTTDLSEACPAEIIVQKDWLAEAEHGAMYQLIGAAGESEQGRYRGPLGSTGIDLTILEGGGPGHGDVPTISTLYAGNNVAGVTPDLAFVSTDDAVTFSEQFPTVAVVAPLERNPQMLMFDPETYDIASVEDLSTAVEDGAQIYVTGTFFSYVRYLIGEGIPESAFITGYAGDKERFVSAGGTLINQGFASNEVYTFEEETPEWGRDVDYVLIDDLGLQTYSSAIAVAEERLEGLSPCLELLVLLIQQAQVDYVTDPAEVNQLLTDFNESDFGAPFWKTSIGLNDAAVEVMLADGLVGNGPNDTLGDFDAERVQGVIDIMLEILESEGADTFDPEVTPEALTTNEFIDESIGL